MQIQVKGSTSRRKLGIVEDVSNIRDFLRCTLALFERLGIVQDIYLTGNPQITFFKVVYRRHTNFAIEAIEQTSTY